MDIAEIKLTRVFSTSFRREIESFFEKYNTITTYILLKKKKKEKRERRRVAVDHENFPRFGHSSFQPVRSLKP